MLVDQVSGRCLFFSELHSGHICEHILGHWLNVFKSVAKVIVNFWYRRKQSCLRKQTLFIKLVIEQLMLLKRHCYLMVKFSKQEQSWRPLVRDGLECLGRITDT